MPLLGRRLFCKEFSKVFFLVRHTRRVVYGGDTSVTIMTVKRVRVSARPRIFFLRFHWPHERPG